MNILFLDLSTKNSGWAVGDESGKLIDYGCIQASSPNVISRIIIMRDSIQRIIQKYHIEKIIAEDVHEEVRNNRTNRVLLWLQGVIQIMTFEKIIPPIEIEFILPTVWRKKIGLPVGRGVKREESKQADMNYVLNKYNITANDDICDAICIHDAYYVKEKKNSSAFEME